MTQESLQEWSERFKTCVYLKGLVTSRNNYIKTISRYDKNGSHAEAIKRAIQLRDETKKEFMESLNGFEYDYIMDNLRKSKLLLKKCIKKNDMSEFENFNPFKELKKNIDIDLRNEIIQAFCWASSIGEQFFDSSRTVEEITDIYLSKRINNNGN